MGEISGTLWVAEKLLTEQGKSFESRLVSRVKGSSTGGEAQDFIVQARNEWSV